MRRFTHIKLGNWKNFRDVDVALDDRVFIVGANAAGKSNLLDVFRFLRDVADPKGGLQRAVEDRGGFAHLRSLYARNNPEVSIMVGVDLEGVAWSYELTLRQSGRAPVRVALERVTRDGSRVGDARPNALDKSDPARLTQTALEQVVANRDFRELAEFFAGTSYRHVVPQIIRQADRGPVRRDDPYGADLLERMLDVPKKTRDARLRAINRALRIAVPQLKELKLDKDKFGDPHLYGLFEHWRPNAGWQMEDQFSDGTLRLLGLLWSLLDGSSPLLLEEPELSLNAAIVRQLPRVMARIAQKSSRQVIVSTHSEHLLQDRGIRATAILLLKPATEGTKVEAASARAEIRHLLDAGVSPGEAVLPQIEPKNALELSMFGT